MPLPGACSISASWLAACLMASPAAPPSTVPVVVGARADGATIVVSVTAATPVAVTPAVDGLDLLVTFEAPVRVAFAPGIVEATAGWIASLQTGYDTLLVRAARESGFDVAVRPDGLDVRLVPRGPAEPAADEAGARRLDLLRAQWFAAQGAAAAELRTLGALADRAPTDPRVLTALGATERRIGWRRRAEATLARALAADRADPEARRLLFDLRADRAPRVRTAVEHKSVAGEWSTDAHRSEGARALSPALSIGGRLEMLRFDARRVRRSSGEITPLRRLRQRADGWIDVDTRGGWSWQVSAAFAATGLGVGGQVARPQPSGRWSLRLDAREPFWELAESLANGGTRDRVAIERRQRLGRRVESWATVAATRYALRDGASTRTAGVSGGLVGVLRERAPMVAVSYGLDKESLRAATTREDAAGARYAPLPIVSREIHVPGVQVRQALGGALVLDVHAGYAVDRLGGRGAVVEAHARWTRGRVGAEVFVDRRRQTLATTTAVTRVGASLAIRLGGPR